MILLKFMYFLIFYLVNINCVEYSTLEYTTEQYTTPEFPTEQYTTPEFPTEQYTTQDDQTDNLPVKSNYDLVRGSAVDMWVSEQDVVYCKLVNPQGLVAYDYFGRCRLSLDRVGSEHHGYWEMHVGYAVKANLDMKKLYINVIEPDSKTKVQTDVREFSPNNMAITCVLPTGYQLQGCKFRGPNDIILVASGTSENTVIINNTRYDTRLEGSGCSFRMFDPSVRDIGFWRCAMYTEQETYYGFFTVISTSFNLQTSVVNTIRQGPLLRADHGDLVVNTGEPVTVSCSIFAPIRYCYFWMSDGTVFNVSPGLKSSSMEYVGSGFDAGECSLKIYDLNYANVNRRWTCNVALERGSQQERGFRVNIRDRMEVSQQSFGTFRMVVFGQIADTELEYCRFVQNSGFGFAYDKTPSRYEFIGSLSRGNCAVEISFPNTWSDYSPWTIVAKVKGEDKEISGRTSGLPVPDHPQYVDSNNGWYIFGWVFVGVVIMGILFGVSLGPQRNRKWITTRATIVRKSFRRQQPPPYTPN